MQVERVLSILNHLSIGPETVNSLHHKLESAGHKVSQRTIYRDLIKLEEAFKLGHIKLRRFDGEFNKATWILATTDPKTIVRDDLYLQTFMTEHFKPEWLKAFTGNAIEDVFTNGNTISESEALVIQKNIAQFSIQHSNWGEFIYNHEHYNRLKDIIWAISNQRIIYIAYYDHNEQVEHKFRPLKVVYHRGTIHLVGWLITGEEVVMQAQELDCIRTTRITNERYQQTNEEAVIRQTLTERFGIHDTVQKEKEHIVLEMGEGPAIFLMNRHWHPTQKFVKVANNSWHMEFTCTINIELVGWIFSWLEHVKVVEPASLRTMMAERAEYITRMYRKNLPPVSPQNTDQPFDIGK